MSLTAKANGDANFQLTPEGQYIGRCFKLIDMGTQTTTGQFGTKSANKVMISWELLDDEVKTQDGRPFAVSQFYTVSLHEKAKLRADLESWRGKKFTEEELEGFDLKNVLNSYCMIQVVHDETGKYANVQTIMAYKGNKPAAVNPNVVFEIDEPDLKVFETFSDGMKTKIMAAPEWKGSGLKDLVQSSNPGKSKSSETTAETTTTTSGNDVVVEDFGDDPINLEDIPF